MYTRISMTNRMLEYSWKPLLFITIYSGFIYWLYAYFGLTRIAIPLAIPTVLGTAISILLGFRTSSAYDRWWEARKIWGSIINDSRTLIRQAIGFISGETKEDDHREIAKKRIAWCYALNYSLRGLSMPGEVKKYLTIDEFNLVTSQDNIPNAILKMEEEKLAYVYQTEGLDTFQFTAMDQTLKGLCDHMGKCERIKKTVFPVQYSYFTRWAILLFLLILPFGMIQAVGVFVIPITIIVIFFFTLIEMIARFMQDPFENRGSDTAMTSICRTIEINLLQMVDIKEIPEKLAPDERGILM